jgi:hypothetical protein
VSSRETAPGHCGGNPCSGTAVLAYLARYTHRVAIANSRLLSLDERG